VLSEDANMKSLARLTVGMTGADLSNVINIAAVRSAANNEKCISMKALESALDRFLMFYKNMMVHIYLMLESL
jgi:ATP-dependent Zn protease